MKRWLNWLPAALMLAGLAAPAPGQGTGASAEVAALARRARALEQAGQLAEAARWFEKAVARAREVHGPGHLATAVQMGNLAEVYRVLGRYDRAEPLFERSLEVLQEKRGKDHPDVGLALNNLALLHQAAGRHARAEPLFRRALAVLRASRGRDHPDVALLLNNLGLLYQDMGQYARPEALYRRSLEIRVDRLGRDHPTVATSLNNLALLYRATGQFHRAEPLFRRSLAIYEARLGEDHLNTASALNNLADLHFSTGRHATAEPLFQRSLRIREKKLGKDHPEVATSLNNLALLYHATGRYTKAEPLFRRALAIYEARLGKEHPHTATVLDNLASLYRALEQYARAEPLFQRGLEIRESKLGKEHPSVARSLDNLASLYQEQGRLAKAGPLYRRSLAIREARRGKDHPAVASSLDNLAALLVRQGQPDRAAPLADRSRRIIRRHLATVLPGLLDSEKADFFRNTNARANLEIALSLGLAGKDVPALAALSAAWLLNGKAANQESLASSLLLARQSDDPAVGKLAGALAEARRDLARLSRMVVRPGQEVQQRERLEALTAREQTLARRLRLAGGGAAAPPPWVELDEARKALPAGAVLIDIARFRPFDSTARRRADAWKPARYVAWVTPRSGAVQRIDLGPAGPIDRAICRLREAIRAAAGTLKKEGEVKAEKALREHLDTLSALVLRPLLPACGSAGTWHLSPDGNLWLVPWEALVLADGKYVVEKHAIAYLSSGRDLLPAAAARVKTAVPWVLADPDYDLEPGKTVPRSGEQSRSPSALAGLGSVPRLEGTRAEARAIVDAFPDVRPRVYLRQRASKARVLAARNPRVLALCTHGFFLPDPELPRDEPGRTRRWENPLLRCGLLLAGCNNAGKGGGDDGVLTGLEVLQIDLRGCELAVLSACETGLGEVQAGEGVACLRQAFQLAGARAVVSSLWRVPDQQSGRLMSLFFRHLAKGKNRAEALRAARLKLIEERREDFAAAHPFFWAAFTITGKP